MKKCSNIDWRLIDTVLLDMDGTILDLAFDNFFWREFLPQQYANKHKIPLAQSRQFLSETYGAIQGTLQWYCLDHWSEKLGLDIAELKQSVSERVAFRPGAVGFLEFLVANKKRVYLVTNAHRKSLEIKLLNANFHQYFDELTSSHDFGYPKEEQNFWIELHHKYQFNPATTLFIDDSVNILKSAQIYGIRYLLAIAQPDLSQPKIDSSPFEAIDNFSDYIL